MAKKKYDDIGNGGGNGEVASQLYQPTAEKEKEPTPMQGGWLDKLATGASDLANPMMYSPKNPADDWTQISKDTDAEAALNDYKMSMDTGNPYIGPVGDYEYKMPENTPTMQMPEYNPPMMSENWTAKLNGILADLENSKFKFDLNGEELYQQYRDQYLRNGRLAMMDTMGQASGLTGGYGSTYAQNAGQQAYQGYVNDLNGIVPDVYNAAYTRYRNDVSDKIKQYQLYADQADREYEQEVTKYNNDYQNLKAQYEAQNPTTLTQTDPDKLVKAGTHTYGPNGELLYIGDQNGSTPSTGFSDSQKKDMVATGQYAYDANGNLTKAVDGVAEDDLASKTLDILVALAKETNNPTSQHPQFYTDVTIQRLKSQYGFTDKQIGYARDVIAEFLKD